MSVNNWIIVLQERRGEHLRQKCKKHTNYSSPCAQLILGPNGVFYANFRRFGANFRSIYTNFRHVHINFRRIYANLKSYGALFWC